MWKRKDLKSISRKTLKANFWCIVGVCFVMAFFAGSYGGTTSFITKYDAEKARTSVTQNQQTSPSDSDYSLAAVLTPILFSGADQKKTEVAQSVTESAIDSISSDEGALYKFVYGFEKLFVDHQTAHGVVFLLSGILGLLFYFFVRNCLYVGQCRFFMETRTYTKTRFSRIFVPFHSGRYLRCVKTMLIRDIFLALWVLTIVGGIIKFYSYRMMPYIIAENPNVTHKEAFALSKKMMDGNKWEAFLLDASFLGWLLLAVLTFGLLNIFYVNPYLTATRVELYMCLRHKAIEDQIPHYEVLNDAYLEGPGELVNA